MKRIFITLFLFSLLTAGIWADPTVLTLEKSIDSALENNLDFQQTRIGLDTAERELDNSWNIFLPSITASAGLTGSDSLSDPDPMAWTATGNVSLNFSLSSGMSATVEGIRLAYESETITYETARLSLINQVEKEFYSLLADKANLDIEKANLELAEKRHEQALRNFRNGLVTELSVMQAEVTAANLKPSYLQAQSDYAIALREFLSTLGMDSESDVVLEGDLKVASVKLDRDSLIDTYIMNRRDILDQQNQIETLKNTRRQTVAGAYFDPSFSLSSGFGTTVADALESGSWSDTALSDTFSVGIALEIPLDHFIPGSSTDTDIKALDDQIKSAELTLRGLVDEARTEIINLTAQLDTAEAQIDLAALNVELTKKTYEKSEESFAQGGMEQLDLEDAQQDYFEAEQDYLESQYSYLSGLIDLRYALGLEDLTAIGG